MPNNLFDKTKKDIIITIKISTDNHIKSLNKKYLHKDETTDVLSFDISEEHDDRFYLGDIIINLDQAKKQAGNYNNSLEQEIAELSAHGVLHLLGIHHDDDDEKAVHGVKSY